MTTGQGRWVGGAPRCDIEPTHELEGGFVDGKTQMGPWACMCLACHRRVGVGLGPGRGQRYEATAVGGQVVWLKVEG